MNHQFQIGVSGYTAFPVIGDPTPVRLLPPPVAPLRFVRRKKRKAFASWDQKVRLMQAGSAVEKHGTWGAEAADAYEKFARGFVSVKTLNLDPARHHIPYGTRRWPGGEPNIVKVGRDDGIVGKLRRGEEL